MQRTKYTKSGKKKVLEDSFGILLSVSILASVHEMRLCMHAVCARIDVSKRLTSLILDASASCQSISYGEKVCECFFNLIHSKSYEMGVDVR